LSTLKRTNPKPLKTVAGVVGKGIKSVTGIFSDDEASNQSQIGDTIKDLESTDTDFSKIIETSNVSNIAGSSSNSNISISAPITINAHTNADEKTIANHVRIAIDEVMHKFAVRKQALNFD
jgi:hypothetical protein